jgi:hypothetical protein
MYQISGTVVHRRANGNVTIQLPTFYLHSEVQGIVDAAGAEKVALDVVNPTNDPSIEPHLYVVSVFEADLVPLSELNS